MVTKRADCPGWPHLGPVKVQRAAVIKDDTDGRMVCVICLRYVGMVASVVSRAVMCCDVLRCAVSFGFASLWT